MLSWRCQQQTSQTSVHVGDHQPVTSTMPYKRSLNATADAHGARPPRLQCCSAPGPRCRRGVASWQPGRPARSARSVAAMTMPLPLTRRTRPYSGPSNLVPREHNRMIDGAQRVTAPRGNVPCRRPGCRCRCRRARVEQDRQRTAVATGKLDHAVATPVASRRKGVRFATERNRLARKHLRFLPAAPSHPSQFRPTMGRTLSLLSSSLILKRRDFATVATRGKNVVVSHCSVRRYAPS